MRVLLLLLLAVSSLCAEVLRDVQQIGSETTWNKYGSGVFDGAGRFCLARTETTGDKDQIQFRCRDGDVWSADQRIDAGQGIESNAKLISAGKDQLRVVWHGQ